ncbi:MAG: T9SS type A sorting domain-containing protein [Chitinophagales bacterium]|nr:T9SS type A sorting domain-containing protein [Chitinophagales bacterium]
MKILSAFILISYSTFATAQSSSFHFSAPAIPSSINNHVVGFKEASLFPANQPGTISSSPSTDETELKEEKTLGFTSLAIGNTYLDIQTNASVCNSLFRNKFNGKISAVWNFAPVLDPDLLSRGTGYNYFNGSSWLVFPDKRIEFSKTGWPNVTVNYAKKEFVLCHNLDFNIIQFDERAIAGTGTWSEIQSPFAQPNFYGIWWPRIMRGDSFSTSKRYLHAIALTLPTMFGGIKYKDIDGALLYYRSSDDGTTWDSVNVLIKGIDSTEYARIRPDWYSMDKIQNNVAIVVGGFGNDIVLLNSGNNGISWTKTIVQAFPIAKYNQQVTDVTGDGVADIVDTNDGSLAVLIDKNGTSHVWAGYNQIYDDDSTDNIFSFQPTSNGILYWNSNMGVAPMKIITGALDFNGNDSLDIAGYGFFNTGFATHPSAGSDVDGNIFLTYSALKENGVDKDNKNVRHTYVIGTSDFGNSWSYPYDIVNEVNAEGIYGKIARDNDLNLRLIYQKDYCAGISTTPGFPDPCNSGQQNQIYYVEVSAQEVLNNVGIENPKEVSKELIYPNPSTGIFHFNLPLLHSQDGNISVTDMNGRILFFNSKILSPLEQVDLSFLPSGIYVAHISSADYNSTSMISVLK